MPQTLSINLMQKRLYRMLYIKDITKKEKTNDHRHFESKIYPTSSGVHKKSR